MTRCLFRRGDVEEWNAGPGSFFEVKKILPLMTVASPDHPSFHVVAIGLPGFGFSEAPHKKGFAGEQYAEVSFSTLLGDF